MSRTTKVALAVVLGWVVLGTIIGLGYIALVGPDQVFEASWDEDASATRAWCTGVRAELTPDKPFASFEEVVQAAIDGELVEPDSRRPETAEELARWEREHGPYLASSYLESLEGRPREVTFAHAAFAAGMGEAHRGAPITDAPLLRSAGRALDAYVRSTC